MKKFLLAFFSFCLVSAGQSQVVLNELFTDPSTAESNQYFELYNTGNAAVNLNCFTIISYYAFSTTDAGVTTNHSGFYVMDLPNFSLAPHAYFVAAAAGGTISSGGKTYTPHFNWNAGVQALYNSDAYLKNYERNSSGNGYTVTDISGIDFLTMHGGKYAVFLFDQGFYTNGFVSGLTTSSTTSEPFYAMPQMSNLRNPCFTYTINWLNVSTAEFVNGGSGTVHGFYRGANGLCGTWAPVADADLSGTALTPATANPVGTVTMPQSGTLTAVQDVCSSTIRYTVSQTGDQGSLPVSVQLYYDKGTIGTLDNADALRPNPGTVSEVPGSGTFDVSGAPAGQKFLLVYRSLPLGCISALAVPTVISGSLQTAQSLQPATAGSNSNYPSQVQVNVSELTVASGPEVASLLPIEARLYIDNDPGNGTAEDTVYLGSKYFTQVSNTGTVTDGEQVFNDPAQQFDADDAGKMVYVVYNTAAACITSTVSFTLETETVLPVRFKLFTATRKGDKVDLKWETATELNNKGFYVQRRTEGEWKDVGFIFSQSQTGNSASGLAYTFTDANAYKGISQYRILQVDLDGTGHFSETRAVQGSATSGKLLLFPNPSATGSVTLVFDSEGTKNVIVTNVSGRIIQQHRSITAGSLNLTNLGSGFYTVQVSDAATGSTTIDKFIVRKL